jgi:hypothetical protein
MEISEFTLKLMLKFQLVKTYRMSKSKNTTGQIKEGIIRGNIRRIAATELSAPPPKPIKRPK